MNRVNSFKFIVILFLIFAIGFAYVLTLSLSRAANVSAEEIANQEYSIMNTTSNGPVLLTLFIGNNNENKDVWNKKVSGRNYSLVEYLNINNDKEFYELKDGQLLGLSYRNGVFINGSIVDENASIAQEHIMLFYDDTDKNFTDDIPIEENQLNLKCKEEKRYQDFMSDFNRVVMNLKKHIGGDFRINIIAHGTGGFIAMNYALNYPNNVADIFAIGTPFEGSNVIDLISSKTDIFNEFAINENYILSLKARWNMEMGARNVRLFAIGSQVIFDKKVGDDFSPLYGYLNSIKSMIDGFRDIDTKVEFEDWIYDNTNTISYLLKFTDIDSELLEPLKEKAVLELTIGIVENIIKSAKNNNIEKFLKSLKNSIVGSLIVKQLGSFKDNATEMLSELSRLKSIYNKGQEDRNDAENELYNRFFPKYSYEQLFGDNDKPIFEQIDMHELIVHDLKLFNNLIDEYGTIDSELMKFIVNTVFELKKVNDNYYVDYASVSDGIYSELLNKVSHNSLLQWCIGKFLNIDTSYDNIESIIAYLYTRRPDQKIISILKAYKLFKANQVEINFLNDFDNYTTKNYPVKLYSFMIKNDGYSSITSQTAMSFIGVVHVSTGYSYNDFTIDDVCNSNMPLPIAHNMQLNNQQIVDFVVGLIQCGVMDQIVVENGFITVIRDDYFQNKDTIVLPNTYKGQSIIGISDSALKSDRFNAIKSITIAEGIEIIGNETFGGCVSLEQIALPTSLKSIGQFAFSGTKITNITIPANVNHIGAGAFADCVELRNIDVEENNMCYMSQNGVLYSKNKDTLIQYPSAKTAQTYIVDCATTTIASYAFYKALINNMCINDARIISEYAFCESNLESLVLGENVSQIQKESFGRCSNLQSVVIYNNNPIIAQYAFENSNENLIVYVPYHFYDEINIMINLEDQNINVAPISYNLLIKVTENASDDISLTHNYGRSLEEELAEIGVNGYVDSASNKNVGERYIENGDLVFEGWRYNCDSNGNGAGLEVFYDNDIHGINEDIIIYAKWRVKQYYLKFSYQDNIIYITKNGITSEASTVAVGDEIQIQSIFYDWFKTLSQTEGLVLKGFNIRETSSATVIVNPDGSITVMTPMPNSGNSYDDIYKTQFDEWAREITDQMIEIPNFGADGTEYVLCATMTPKIFKFVYDANGGNPVADNGHTHQYNEAFTPVAGIRENYVFSCWRIVDIKIDDNQSIQSSFINKKYTYNKIEDFTIGLSKNATVYLKAEWEQYNLYVTLNTDNVVNQFRVVNMDFSGYDQGESVNKKFTISSNVDVLYLTQMKLLKNVSFEVEGSIEIYLNGVMFSGMENCSGIKALNNASIELHAEHGGMIEGGFKTDGSDASYGAGISCNFLTVYGSSQGISEYLYFVGGNGKDGSNGTSSNINGSKGIEGGHGIYSVGKVRLMTGNIFAVGGTGGKGGTAYYNYDVPGKSSNVGTAGYTGYTGANGGKGGNGIALIGVLQVESDCTLYAVGGTGGNGGKGGKGGTGGEGADGRFGFAAKAGGTGGKGGTGGQGGDGGFALYILGSRKIYGTINDTSGTAGTGGQGGDGGNGGQGGVKWRSSKRASTGSGGAQGDSGQRGYTH